MARRGQQGVMHLYAGSALAQAQEILRVLVAVQQREQVAFRRSALLPAQPLLNFVVGVFSPGLLPTMTIILPVDGSISTRSMASPASRAARSARETSR
jgi:hypothetical protein